MGSPNRVVGCSVLVAAIAVSCAAFGFTWQASVGSDPALRVLVSTAGDVDRMLALEAQERHRDPAYTRLEEG